jgi:tetratricopeptide (TPR) repeat protein
LGLHQSAFGDLMHTPDKGAVTLSKELMRCSLRWIAVFVCLVFSVPLFGGEAQWVEIRSPHFSVITDAGDKRGRDVAVRFEQMRAVFGALMVKAKVSTPIPLQIIAFRTSKELRQFTPIFHGKPTELAGLFQGSSDRCFIMLDMSSENPWQTVFHEYAHQLMNGTIPEQLDPWFEEGFAEYFRTVSVDGKEADVGKIPDDEYQVLEHNGWLKVADLFKVQQYTKTYNESGDRRTVFYAESGMMVHYLYDNGIVSKVGDYFTLVRNHHVAVEEAIQKAFGMSPAQFDKALLNYEKSGHFRYYKLAAPAGIDAKTYSSASLNPADVQATLADVHLHSADYQNAAPAEFEAVLKLDPNNAAALRGLGYSYLMKQDFAKAGDCFHKAAKLSPNDPRILYYSAMLYQREGRELGANDERTQSMQSELLQSIKLDPEFADAHSMLAFTYRAQGKRDEAVASLKKAIELDPRNDPYQFNLANLYLEHQQFDEATAILQSLRNSGDPEVASRSARALAEIQRYKNEMRAYSQAIHQEVIANSVVDHNSSPPAEPETLHPKVAQAKFLHGKLVSVDCSGLPEATLTILNGAKKLILHVSNSKKATVIGADELSCDWKSKNVAVNYRETGEGEGDLISLEMQ